MTQTHSGCPLCKDVNDTYLFPQFSVKNLAEKLGLEFNSDEFQEIVRLFTWHTPAHTFFMIRGLSTSGRINCFAAFSNLSIHLAVRHGIVLDSAKSSSAKVLSVLENRNFAPKGMRVVHPMSLSQDFYVDEDGIYEEAYPIEVVEVSLETLLSNNYDLSRPLEMPFSRIGYPGNHPLDHQLITDKEFDVAEFNAYVVNLVFAYLHAKAQGDVVVIPELDLRQA